MKTEHTAGPWTIHNNIGRKGELGILADKAPCIIAIMGNAKEWPVEARANARLIAAAPELLSAAVALMAEMSSRFDYETATEEESTAFAKMEAAISKAH